MASHNHITRDVRPRGSCPGCDEYHDAQLEKAWAEQLPECNFFWGSHGCSLPAAWPHRVHLCSSYEWALDEDDEDVKTLSHCCEYDEDRPADARVNWWYHDGTRSGWKEYGEGWRQ